MVVNKGLLYEPGLSKALYTYLLQTSQPPYEVGTNPLSQMRKLKHNDLFKVMQTVGD